MAKKNEHPVITRMLALLLALVTMFSLSSEVLANSMDEGSRVTVTTMEFETITISSKDAVDINTNEETIYKYLTTVLKLNKAGACAVLGNLYIESKYSPTAYNSYENAWGLCQWENRRLTNLQSRYPSTWKTMSGQLSFLKDEFEGVDYAGPQTLAYLKKLPDTEAGARDGAQYFAKYFERCAISTYSKRQDWAEEVYIKRSPGCPAPTITSAIYTEDNTLSVSWARSSIAKYATIELLDASGNVVANTDTELTSFTFNNLKEDVVKVRIWCVKADGTASDKVVQKVSLKTPSMTSVGCGRLGMVVRWNEVPHAEQYYVYRRATGTTTWTKIATVNRTVYTDTAVANGKDFTYTVRAAKGSVVSGYKKDGLSYVYVRMPVMNDLKKNMTGIYVTWRPVTNATKYIIYRKTGAQGFTKIGVVNAGSTLKFVDSKVSKGKTYTYAVRTVRGTYYSAYDTTGKTIKY